MTSDWDRILNPFRYDSDGNLTDQAKQHDARMQLDHVQDGGSGSEGKVLRITPSRLRDLAGKAETAAHNFKKADDSAMAEGKGGESRTGAVAAGLDGFDCANAFAVFEKRWNDQMKYVTNMLLDGVAGGLRAAADEHESTDIENANKQRQ
jgi:Excreted virulence factor EspC, type VII ESX diderm